LIIDEVLQLANSLSRKWDLLQESKNKMAGLEETVLLRTAQMVQEQEKFKDIFENSPEGIFQISADGRVLTANPALAAIYGYASPQELLEQVTDCENQLYVDPQRRAEFGKRLEEDGMVREFESEIKCKDGSRKWISETACQVTRLDGSLLHYQGFVLDITAQKNAEKERDLMEVHLRQSQKLESIGQLAAGIAHEINSPTQFIGDNLSFMQEVFDDLLRLLGQFHLLLAATRGQSFAEGLAGEIEKTIQTIDLADLEKEIPQAINQALSGVKRVAKIVQAMKDFSHPGTDTKMPIDLNRAIESTLTVCRNEWKYVADVHTDFDPCLPPVSCLPGEFNQAILNIVVNAAHAIADKVDGKGKGSIGVKTRHKGDIVEIRISDTGTGIPELARGRIFDPFFTTKEVGKGTGQGLAIARSVVVDKHQGEITFETVMGQGTTFVIRLPQDENKDGQAAAKK
jgi:PAS domain S-box-containing protein